VRFWKGDTLDGEHLVTAGARESESIMILSDTDTGDAPIKTQRKYYNPLRYRHRSRVEIVGLEVSGFGFRLLGVGFRGQGFRVEG
jgi:hypothetical protein